MIDVSIIIVNYNTCDLTLDCIKTIYEKTQGVSYEILVVDNASVDDSIVKIRNTYNNVILFESSENLGFGKANNLAALGAKGKYLFFLNSDTLLVNDAISVLKNYLDTNPNVGICGGNLYDQSMNPTHSHLKVFPSIFNDVDLATRRIISKIFCKNMQFNYTESPIEVAYITGADFMISSELYNKVGGFDPDFFLYFEETELTFRVCKLGFKVVNVPQSKIIHLEGRSSTYSPFKLKVMQQSKSLFFSKCYSKFYCIIAKVNYILINLGAVILCLVVNPKEGKRLLLKMKYLLNIS